VSQHRVSTLLSIERFHHTLVAQIQARARRTLESGTFATPRPTPAPWRRVLGGKVQIARQLAIEAIAKRRVAIPKFLNGKRHELAADERGYDVKNLSQIWAVAPALVKLALRDDRRSQFNKEPPWKRIAERPHWAT
jgi:hypothetical protein